MRSASLALILALSPAGLFGQGLPFHTETALTMAFEERGVRALFLLQRTGDVTVAVWPMVILPYAPHQRLTTKVVIPLVLKRLSAPAAGSTAFSNWGVGDVTLAAKWAFFVGDRREGTSRLAIAVSGSMPTGSTDAALPGGARAPRSIQLGRGSVAGSATAIVTLIRGRWGLSADIGHTRAAGDAGFRTGPATRYDVAFAFRLPRRVADLRARTLQLYLEWNGSILGRATQDGSVLYDTGGHVAYLSPGAQWVVTPQALVEASVQVPLVKALNGSQPDPGMRTAAGFRFVFF